MNSGISAAGVYFLRQCEEGHRLYSLWLHYADNPLAGHDQDGLNLVVRGSEFRPKFHNRPMPAPLLGTPKKYAGMDPDTPNPRAYYAAADHGIGVGMLSAACFGNSYTYAIGRLHEVCSFRLVDLPTNFDACNSEINFCACLWCRSAA